MHRHKRTTVARILLHRVKNKNDRYFFPNKTKAVFGDLPIYICLCLMDGEEVEERSDDEVLVVLMMI